jgi:hypothetical protein
MLLLLLENRRVDSRKSDTLKGSIIDVEKLDMLRRIINQSIRRMD